MRTVATAVGTMMALGGAWIVMSDNARIEGPVVLTRPLPPPRQDVFFAETLPAFGGSAAFGRPSDPVPVSEASEPASPDATSSGPPERIMGEAELRMITHADIARMQAAGIGMNVGDRQSDGDAS